MRRWPKWDQTRLTPSCLPNSALTSFGFNLPLRTPTTIRKNPVWEYKAGVLELKKVAR